MIFPVVVMLLLVSLLDISIRRIPSVACLLLLMQSITRCMSGVVENGMLGWTMGSLIVIAAYFVSSESIGEGDIKMISALSLGIGFPGIISLMGIACLLSISAFLILKKEKVQTIAFAPLISISYIIVVFLQGSSF